MEKHEWLKQLNEGVNDLANYNDAPRFKEFFGEKTQAIRELQKENRDLLSVANILERRLDVLEKYPLKKRESNFNYWFNKNIITGDAIYYDHNEIKIVLQTPQIKNLNGSLNKNLRLNESIDFAKSIYNKLDGLTFNLSHLEKLSDSKRINLLWKAIVPDSSLLKNYKRAMYLLTKDNYVHSSRNRKHVNKVNMRINLRGRLQYDRYVGEEILGQLINFNGENYNSGLEANDFGRVGEPKNCHIGILKEKRKDYKHSLFTKLYNKL